MDFLSPRERAVNDDEFSPSPLGLIVTHICCWKPGGHCINPDALKGRKLVAGGNAPGTVVRNPSDPERVA